MFYDPVTKKKQIGLSRLQELHHKLYTYSAHSTTYIYVLLLKASFYTICCCGANYSFCKKNMHNIYDSSHEIKEVSFAAEWDFNSFAGTPLEPDFLGCVKHYMVVHKV